MTSYHLHIPAFFLKKQSKMVAACGDKKQGLWTTIKVPAHEGSWRRDMSQQHPAATNHVFFTRKRHAAGTCSWNTYNDKVTLRTHDHVPYVWTTHDFVAAACRCDISLRHDPSCARTLSVKSSWHIDSKWHFFSHNKDSFRTFTVLYKIRPFPPCNVIWL